MKTEFFDSGINNPKSYKARYGTFVKQSSKCFTETDSLCLMKVLPMYYRMIGFDWWINQFLKHNKYYTFEIQMWVL